MGGAVETHCHGGKLEHVGRALGAMPREKDSWGPGEGRTGVVAGRPVNWDGRTPRSAVDGRGGDE